jgi:hypothetical protein
MHTVLLQVRFTLGTEGKVKKVIVIDAICSPVAQLAEQVAVNHWVRGSSPCWGAKQIKGLREIVSPFSLMKFLISNHTSNHSYKTGQIDRFYIPGGWPVLPTFGSGCLSWILFDTEISDLILKTQLFAFKPTVPYRDCHG